MNPLKRLHEVGQAFWLDNIRRSMLTSGELARMVTDDGLRGLTSNPTIFEKAIGSSSDYDEAIANAVVAGAVDAEQVFFALAADDIRGAADVLRPVYDSSGGADGFCSLELPPALARDTEGSVAEAQRLFSLLDRPNVMIKVPGTPEGIPAFRELIGLGININVTLLFSCDVYEEVAEAYIDGLEALVSAGGDPSRVASVASFFVSRVDKKCDDVFDRSGRIDLLGKVGIANAKDAYQRFQRIFSTDRFRALQEKGARVQRCLWASTSTKDPRFSDVLYVENLIGPDTVNTMPEATVDAFRDHGRVVPTLTEGVDEALALIASLPDAGIDLAEVTADLQDEGVDAFAADFDRLIGKLAQKREDLQAGRATGARRRRARLGDIARDVEREVRRAEVEGVAHRIWEGDHTLWSDDPAHKEVIVNRLGWLSVHERMEDHVDLLREFAAAVKDDDVRHVVLLGMGGSSLAPLVMRSALGIARGYPDLIVLDSTHPLQVAAVEDAIDPAATLFVVSSKSGTTIEPVRLYKHFRRLAPPERFAAVTDPGTPLAELGERESFRRVFLNPPDIGGRYSALSCFGLVPAALIGADIAALLEGAADMAAAAARSVPAGDNPALWLGCALGAAAKAGRDKVTLLCSAPLESFGLWAEQLIAESTGKDSTGLIPVAGEPLGPSGSYGADRVFVALRMDGDGIDAELEALVDDGHPVIELFCDGPLDLGREFWRFEFATAVAGWSLGIDPFDEPNVAEAKAATGAILEAGRLPDVETPPVDDVLRQVQTGDYVAICAYLPYTGEADVALQELRARIRARTGAATTVGYGPRYLHSTGQLHKGGPDIGVFVIVTSGDDDESGFGRLMLAQAMGDLQTLQRKGRRVARVHVNQPYELAGVAP